MESLQSNQWPKKEEEAAFSVLIREYLLPMTPGSMVRDLLEASFDPDVPAHRIASIIRSDSVYSHYIENLDILREKIAQWKQDIPEGSAPDQLIRTIVVLLGRKAVRNAILTIWINLQGERSISQDSPQAPFPIVPTVHLKYSIKTDDYCETQGIAHAERAAVAALCFDWIAAILEKKGGTVKTQKRFLEDSWPEALRCARVAYELASVPKHLALSEFAFSSMLLLALGRVLMSASYPPKTGGGGLVWKEFLRQCDQSPKGSRLMQRYLEKRKFAWTHSEASAFCASLHPQLRSSEAAIRSYLEPYLLRHEDPDSLGLAVILSAATELGRGGGISALRPDDLRELKALGIGQTEIRAAVAKARK